MNIELYIIRCKIDKIDKSIINLLAKRIKLVNKIKEIKNQYNLPIYVPERELNIIKSRCKEAHLIGLSSELIESILYYMIRKITPYQ